MPKVRLKEMYILKADLLKPHTASLNANCNITFFVKHQGYTVLTNKIWSAICISHSRVRADENWGGDTTKG